MIDLYQFTPAFGHANLSPHCMKVEAFLRISELPFQIINEDKYYKEIYKKRYLLTCPDSLQDKKIIKKCSLLSKIA